jgi:hypothetical protein
MDENGNRKLFTMSYKINILAQPDSRVEPASRLRLFNVHAKLYCEVS